MKKRNVEIKSSGSEWRGLSILGGAAALAAGILFRRNLAVEIDLFGGPSFPAAPGDWFALLQSNRVLGLAYLHLFDLVNYLLVGVMLLALCVVLGRIHRSAMTVAAAAGFMGIAVYLATNTAFSMLALSDQYAAATTGAERDLLKAAGQALLAVGRFTSPGAHPGSGGFMSLLLVAVAGLIASAVMLRSSAFPRSTPYIGLLAGAMDALYCITFLFSSAANREALAAIFIPAAGFFWMIWHILVGWGLLRLGKSDRPAAE